MEIIDWIFRALMVLSALLVFWLERDHKRAEELVRSRAEAVEDHLRLELKIRDQRLNAIDQRLDHAGQRSSDLASRVQMLADSETVDKLCLNIITIRERLIILESKVDRYKT